MRGNMMEKLEELAKHVMKGKGRASCLINILVGLNQKPVYSSLRMIKQTVAGKPVI